MDQKLDAIGKKELILFFHWNKTKMSCMANPQVFLSQLKDHYLIPEDKYKEMGHEQSKETLQGLLYDYLDWFEMEGSEDIKKFWSCVFQDTTLKHYRELQELHAVLIGQSDGPLVPTEQSTTGEKETEPQPGTSQAPALGIDNVLSFESPENRLRRFRPDFIKGMSQPNLDQVLDKLLEEGVINQEEMQSTKGKAKADKARYVINMVMNKGREASSVLIRIICQVDPYLSLGL